MSLAELLHSPPSLQLAHCHRDDEEFLATLCAMANAQGGTIVLDIRAASGEGAAANPVEPEAMLARISAALQPAVIPEIEIPEHETGGIAVVRVPEAPLKPVAVNGKCFQRAGARNLLLSAAEIARLHLQSVNRSWDAMPCESAQFADLDPDKIQRFLQIRSEQRRPVSDAATPLAEQLEQLGLLQRGRPTMAAVLLFGRNPQAHLAQARIKAGRFKGETVIVDEQEITGTLFEQIEQAFAFIQKHLTVRLVISGQLQREDVWDYPLPALREGLINAICHRDYTAVMATQIRIYDDQLLIWNPGSLPPNLQIEDLRRRHQSVLRNKLIGAAFYDAGLVEKWGSGTNRIIEECRKLGLPEPEWREQQGIMLSLRKDRLTEDFLLEQDLNERQLQAVAYVKRRRRITNQEYQELVGVKKRTASDELRELEEKGILERVGSTGKGTYYKIKGK
ncbi:MAG: putative DNA binding domain-containing protein [candidate division KSB1 bacterium]|nr:putative DNA binding domain-containing protein [candidate division KSB1 bacterium]MDZ7275497.1 putative DNA binding domain-containing protein [candidate division KSB1 bacterium]MDZ7286191.1 putative DNA binding domain-containing protein [candidate division KSB1 bacterium]MDZ7296417.1 putative DNA binding domain-containing protein [candidate division KSB1 bacterium]MDZ7308947.1 putative DNA binding domain-containing protein [candidate division KSB1 bacterium]